MKKDVKFAIATLIIMVPLMFVNVWFLREIWNIAVLTVFPSLPILTYTQVFILYLVGSLFNLYPNIDAGYWIKNMIVENKGYTEVTFYTTISKCVLYFLTWLIVVKIIL
jgi:hypothetical protein